MIPLQRLIHLTLCLGCLLVAASAQAQLVVEDLEIEEQLVSPEIERIFENALALFNSVDQADSLPLFGQVVDELQPMAITGDERVLQLLNTSLLQRAEANFNFGETDATRSDLVTLVTISPGYELDSTLVSERVARLFESVRSDLVGFVEFAVDPQDARVTVNGALISTDSGPVPILAGAYSANIQRPGFTPTTQSFEVAPNKSATVEAILERTSAVISLRTRPTGAKIFIDGVERVETSGEAEPGFVPTGDAASFDRSEFSREAFVDGLDIGSLRVEVRQPGFRSFETTVEIGGMVDVDLGAIALEQEAGTLVLTELPDNAEVQIDERTVRPFTGARQGSAELLLAPGTYVLSVTRGVFGRFETTIDIVDRKATQVAVRLRPALVMLGVLGKDEVGARRLSDGLSDVFQARDQWALLDRAATARPILDRFGANAEKLRRTVTGLDQTPLDWAGIQQAMDEQVPGSVYVLGVLSDDLLANEASLWIWPAAPGPSNPELRRVVLGDTEALQEFAAGFQPKLDPIRPTFGATLIDTPLAGGPVIIELVAGQAAQSAGFALGDAITSVGGVPVYSEAMFLDEFLKVAAGGTVNVEYQRGEELLQAEVSTGRSFTVIDLSDPRRVAAPLAAALASELQQASDWPRWVLQLNQAAILLHAGDSEAAVRELRQIDATQTPGDSVNGLNMGTVNYWLGVALEQAGPRYLDRARDAYERAAASPGARFLHDDGPRVAPRAWARLQRLAPQ